MVITSSINIDKYILNSYAEFSVIANNENYKVYKMAIDKKDRT
jgi:16S rRNA G1207 methylase RsmC